MITGVVSRGREALVSLVIRGEDEAEHELEGVVDTGFNGSITLPQKVIEDLDLKWRSRGRVLLGDGRETVCDLYEAVVLWDGSPRRVLADSAETKPLLGMGLLEGYELSVRVVDGGTVSISKLGPQRRSRAL